MADKYDVVIVGARVAGATLATFLARDGAKVAILDADARHSDVVVSTHLLHPAGMDVLEELGVAQALKRETPAWNKWRFNIEGAIFDVPMPPSREEYAPRRLVLDGLLQDAAEAAGAKFKDTARLEELIVDAGRVRGVKFSHAGSSIELEADLVVGADGRNSTVAKLTGAEEYFGYDSPRGAYWAYWETPAGWRSDAWPFQGYFAVSDGAIRFFIETNANQLLIGTAPPVETMTAWRSTHADSYFSDIQQDPVISTIIEGSKPVSDVRGTLRERYFFRRAVGPGWALVGDAGHHKDFVIGDGITQALRDARNLAAVLRQGNRDEALRQYWRERDVEAQPFFRAAQQQADLNQSVRLNRFIFERVGQSPKLIELFRHQFEHDMDPFDTVPLSVVIKAMLGGLMRGQLGVVKEFLDEGKRISAVQSEGKRLRKLLAQQYTDKLP
jgi:2-polyprenyl-6-methoxyphenol hydroxylase-like FAD-dependent oxidoreductase